MNFRIIFLYSVFTVLLISFFACGDMENKPSVKENKMEKFPKIGIDGIKVENLSGNIYIRDNTGDENNITVKYTKIGWSQFDIDRVSVEIEEIQNEFDETFLSIKSAHDKLVRDVSLEYEILIPKDMAVVISSKEGNVKIYNCNNISLIEVNKGNISIEEVESVESINLNKGALKAEKFSEIKSIMINDGSAVLDLKQLSENMAFSVKKADISLLAAVAAVYKEIIVKSESVEIVNEDELPLKGSGKGVVSIEIEAGSVRLIKSGSDDNDDSDGDGEESGDEDEDGSDEGEQEDEDEGDGDEDSNGSGDSNGGLNIGDYLNGLSDLF